MRKIVLASSSPRRKQLLKQLGVEFVVDASNIDEKLNPRYKPRRQVEMLSLQKAEAIAHKHADAVIIAADSMVAVNNEVLGKPKDIKHAKQMLKMLSGTTHWVITGMTIIDTKSKKVVTTSSETKVVFKKLTPREINNYLLTKEPYDKAGAYALQGLSAIFVERIEGDYFGAMGLPLNLLAEEFKKCDIHILS